MQSMDLKSVRVVTWNVRSHDRRRTVIEKLLASNNIMLMQETKKKTRPPYDEDNFYTYFKPSAEEGNAKRGLLTVVRNSLPTNEVSTPGNPYGVETQAINISVEGQQYILVNLYAPGEKVTTATAWKEVLNPLLSLGKRVIVSGDFNARSTLWLDEGTNSNGKALEEALPEINGIILNNDAPTRIPDRASDAHSAIDLSNASPDLAASLKWKLLPLMDSDHRPVLVTIPKPRTIDSGRTRLKPAFQYRKTGKKVIEKCRRAAADRKRLHKKDDAYQDRPKWWTDETQAAWDAKMEASKQYCKARKDGLSAETIENMKGNSTRQQPRTSRLLIRPD